jgi:aldehyde dehydrogenase (NAD+)
MTDSVVEISYKEKQYKLQTGLFINNKFVPSISGKKFDTVNPSNGKVITSVYEADGADVDVAVAAAKEAFKTWGRTTPTSRGRLLSKLADLMERDRQLLAEIESLDNGKPVLTAFAADLGLSISHLRYYAGWADKNPGQMHDVGEAFQAYTKVEPIGVCGQIIPWNFPLLMLAWKWGPALACGNTIVMKTSEKTPLSALKMCELAVEAGFPAGVINVLSGFGPSAGSAISNHMDIKKVAFTGSTGVGRLVMEAASKSNLKKVSLELGGKSPNIVFPDADLDAAIKWATTGIFFNQGQCCCAGSRLFLHEDIYDKFIEKFKEKAASMKVTDGFDPTCELGPLVDKLQFDRVMGFIEKGKKEGATVETGGTQVGTEGYFVSPTLFTGLNDNMTVAREEIFGPVVCALKFKTEEEVILRANDTPYGLGAAVHTKDIRLAARMVNAIESGTVWVNCYNVFMDQLPFGGYKQSGIGREMGEYALREYTQIKTVISSIIDGV